MESNPQQSRYYWLNLVSCISGVLVILWFALGVEKQNSSAQVLFEWMLKHSTPIIVALISLMVLLLVGSYFAMKAMKNSQGEDKST